VCGGSPDHNTMKVKIKFESAPNPEGLSRLIEEYDKTILPFVKDEDGKKGTGSPKPESGT